MKESGCYPALMRLGRVVVLMVALVLSLLPAAQGQNPLSAARAQLLTAFDISDRAQLATSLTAAHLLMRQVVNCLEGPRGKNFTVAAGNPCQRQGNGILVDLQAVVDAGNARLGKALRFSLAAHTFALAGLARTDVEAAQTYAWMTAFDIGNALEALE